MTDDAELLRQYATTGSESAFEELVRRHLPLVYSAALRQVRGDQALAKDVAQTVFIDLARKARSVVKRELLAGWLYASTRLAASNAIRAESRRRQRESVAVAMQENTIPPSSDQEQVELRLVLDEAMTELTPEDRNAVLLRFFQGRELREVGSALGISEDAARMRVNRSLGKLQSLLVRRGVALPAAALATVLASEAASAAPAGLAATIAGAALANAGAGAGVALTLTKLITMTKVKLGIIGAMVVAGVATPVVIQHQSQTALREKEAVVRQQTEQLAQREKQLTELTAQNGRLSNLVAQAGAAQPLPAEQQNELLKLRAEVTRLRNDARASRQLKPAATTAGLSENLVLLKQWAQQMPERNIPEMSFLKEQAWREAAARLPDNPGQTDALIRTSLSELRDQAKQAFSLMMGRALQKYAQTNSDQLPTDVTQLKPYFEPAVEDAVLQRYQMLKSGSVKDLPPNELVVGEKAPVDEQYDSLFQIGLNGNKSQGIGALSGRSTGGTWGAPDSNTTRMQMQQQVQQQTQQQAGQSGQGQDGTATGATSNFSTRVTSRPK
jgi:RNA polymerase sigma factor (sigma-70 family)